MKRRLGVLFLGFAILSCKTSSTSHSQSSSGMSGEPHQNSENASAEDLAKQLHLTAQEMANSTTCQNPTPENASVCANAKTLSQQSTSSIQQNIILAPPADINSVQSYVNRANQPSNLLIAGNVIIILGSLVFLESFVSNVRTFGNLGAAKSEQLSAYLADASEHFGKQAGAVYERQPLPEYKKSTRLIDAERQVEIAGKKGRGFNKNLTLLGIGAALELIGIGLSATATNRIAAKGYNLADEISPDTNPDVTQYLTSVGTIFNQMQKLPR